MPRTESRIKRFQYSSKDVHMRWMNFDVASHFLQIKRKISKYPIKITLKRKDDRRQPRMLRQSRNNEENRTRAVPVADALINYEGESSFHLDALLMKNKKDEKRKRTSCSRSSSSSRSGHDIDGKMD